MSVGRLLGGVTIFMAGALTGAVVLPVAQGAPTMTARVLLNVTTEELRWAKTSLRVNLDSWEPGSETGPHQHPGPAILYILDGELEETSADGTLTLRTGEAVYNRGKRPHTVKNRTGRSARALAVHLDPGR